MAEYANKLHFISNGVTQTASAYSTTAEAGSDYVPVMVGGSTLYVPIGSTSHPMATKGRVMKNGTTYAILSGWGPKTVLVQRTRNRSYGNWYGDVGGQDNHSYAQSVGWSVLNNYESYKGDFINISGSEYTGGGIPYKDTVYHCFRVYSYYMHPQMNIDIRFTTTDGGNGQVIWSGLRTHSQWYKDFVISGGGGDKGHYGEGLVQITVSAPGINTISYTGRFWIDSD